MCRDTRTNKVIADFLAETHPVPGHVHAVAGAIRYDLMHGPAWVRVPAAGIESLTPDHLYSVHEDAEDDKEPGDRIVSAYAQELRDVLQDFIGGLPSSLYVDEDDCVSTSEPEGETLEYEDPDTGETVETYCEPTPYSEVSGRDITRALFGKTIAEELY